MLTFLNSCYRNILVLHFKILQIRFLDVDQFVRYRSWVKAREERDYWDSKSITVPSDNMLRLAEFRMQLTIISIIRATTGGKAGKTTVLPIFCRIERSSGSSSMPVKWLPLWGSYLPKIYRGSPDHWSFLKQTRNLAFQLHVYFKLQLEIRLYVWIFVKKKNWVLHCITLLWLS